MHAAFLSAFPPYRGGISQFSTRLVTELRKAHAVDAFTFTRQYPDLLFPGSSQFDHAQADPVGAVRVLDSAGPWTWGRTARAMAGTGAEVAVLRYWMPFFAPSMGAVARGLRHRGAATVCIVDNAIPHEPKAWDKPFTRWFLRQCDGLVALTDAVERDIRALHPGARTLVLPHPLYDHFGDPLPADGARARLGIPSDARVLLFFGLIRAYKGLDILLDAFAGLDGRYHLVIAGEPYEDLAPNLARIAALPDPARVHVHARYVPDAEVPLFFSAADAVVLPYRSGTQSGITAIAQHFATPVIATDVGGLKEAIEDGVTGLVVKEPSADAVRAAITAAFEQGGTARFRQALLDRKAGLSWSVFAEQLVRFCEAVRRDRKAR